MEKNDPWLKDDADNADDQVQGAFLLLFKIKETSLSLEWLDIQEFQDKVGGLWWITHSCFIPFIPRCRGGIGKSHHKAETWSFKGPETKTAQEVSSKSCDLWYSSALRVQQTICSCLARQTKKFRMSNLMLFVFLLYIQIHFLSGIGFGWFVSYSSVIVETQNPSVVGHFYQTERQYQYGTTLSSLDDAKDWQKQIEHKQQISPNM